MEEAGAFAVVIEGVPAKIAALITEQLHIPTIGIGAGKDCDGQVLVYQDMLGMFSDFTPKFVKRYANIGEVMKEAFQNYIKEVQEDVYKRQTKMDSQNHGFGLKNIRDIVKKYNGNLELTCEKNIFKATCYLRNI